MSEERSEAYWRDSEEKRSTTPVAREAVAAPKSEGEVSPSAVVEVALREAREIRAEAERYRETAIREGMERGERVYNELVKQGRQVVEELKESATAEAQRTIADAQVSARAIKAQVEREAIEAEALLRQAREEAEKVLAESRIEAERIKEAAASEAEETRATVARLEASYAEFLDDIASFLQRARSGAATRTREEQPAASVAAPVEQPLREEKRDELTSQAEPGLTESEVEPSVPETELVPEWLESQVEAPIAEEALAVEGEGGAQFQPWEEVVGAAEPAVAEQASEDTYAGEAESAVAEPISAERTPEGTYAREAEITAAEPASAEQAPSVEITTPQLQPQQREGAFLDAFRSFLRGPGHGLAKQEAQPEVTPVTQAQPEPIVARTYEGEVEIAIAPLYSLEKLTRFQGLLLRIPSLRQIKSIRTSETNKGAVLTVQLANPAQLGDDLHEVLPAATIQEEPTGLRVELPPTW